MKLINEGIIKFDYQFPLYNFFFPSQSHNVYAPSLSEISKIFNLASEKASSRALYFHIPFCEKICSFCPFTRGLYKSSEEIDRYTDALVKEIEIKSNLTDLKAVPIKAIFFGGGTPSLLSPSNIYKIGEALHKSFDLSELIEFSFEFHVTSVTKENSAALFDIGGTHARFGFQTVNTHWRRLFNLVEDVSVIENAASILTDRFDHVLCDILYGMNGSDEEQTISDIDKAISLGVSNLDIYPINNVATSVKLHKNIKEHHSDVMSAIRKLNMKLMIDEHARSRGFMPYNGHGYVKSVVPSAELITDQYSFVYHEHVYGYSTFDLLGFGVGAISSTSENVITNTPLREKYMSAIEKGECVCQVSEHDSVLDIVKPLVLRLPYHGRVDKSLIDMQAIPEGLLRKVQELVNAGLVLDTPEQLELTRQGFLWYSNIMFYLIPESEQNILKRIVYEKLNVSGKDISQKEIIYSAAN